MLFLVTSDALKENARVGLRTLRTRIDVWSQSALKVARFLKKQPSVTDVNYLGLEDHPLYPVASKYLWLADSEYDDRYGKKVNRYGHLLSFRVKDGPQAARKVFDRLQLIMRVTDLGRVKSIGARRIGVKSSKRIE